MSKYESSYHKQQRHTKEAQRANELRLAKAKRKKKRKNTKR